MTGYQPSEVLQGFLDYVDQIKAEYQSAREAVGKEDKRLQDLLHELEFAEDKAARNRVATKFQRSRRERRRQKDEVQRLELLIDFFDQIQDSLGCLRVQCTGSFITEKDLRITCKYSRNCNSLFLTTR